MLTNLLTKVTLLTVNVHGSGGGCRMMKIRPEKKDLCLSFSDRPKSLENMGCFFFF